MPLDDEQMETYLNRILPVVGDCLRDKVIAFFNLQLTHRIAEAFARCGVSRFVFFDNSLYGFETPMHRSYGDSHYQVLSAAEALEIAFLAHNHFQSEWEFTRAARDKESMLSTMKGKKVDLLVGAGTVEQCRMLIAIGRELKIPVVTFCLFVSSRINGLVAVIDPDRGVEETLFDRLPAEMAEGDGSNRFNWLDISDLAGSLAKAVLLQGTRYEREDIREIVYDQKRNSILYGSEQWPWWIFYGSPRSYEQMLEMIRERRTLPSGSDQPLTGERIMLIGCGTGSLLMEEAQYYYRDMLLADCKPFSVYNPIRQYVSTSEIDGVTLKPFTLQEKLARRVHGSRERRSYPLGSGVHIGSQSIYAAELEVKEALPQSVEKLEALLDWFQPTLVIIGIGRPRDENYVVARACRDRGIRHISYGMFPLATHYVNLLITGHEGPCYGCFQGRLAIDQEGAAELTQEQRDMFYGRGSFEEGTQPATIFEPWPSIHSLLRLAVQFSRPEDEREPWFQACLEQERQCFVGANISIDRGEGHYLCGVEYPGQVVTYSSRDIVDDSGEPCLDCGRVPPAAPQEWEEF